MSGQMIILEIHQVIEIPHLTPNLLCPMQMRVNDIKVNEQPKLLTHALTDESHAIVSGHRSRV